MPCTAAVSMQRRRFLRGGTGPRGTGVHPPWAVAETFLATCTRCDACADACPQRILVRGEGGYPRVEFARGECTFCGDCASACVPGALRRTSPPAVPWLLAARITDACLAARGIECRVCGEACAAAAIRFPLRAGAVARPQLDLSVCTGCGACVAPCPVAAISVINPVEFEP